jgi:ornithine cyclodeaminase/alanine dehydrogenase-like protein (mu-crystallin family)
MPERILFLSDADVRQLLDMRTALEVCEQVFRAMAARQVRWGDPPKLNLHPQAGPARYFVKACAVDSIPAAGFRLVGYRPDPGGRISGGDTRHIVLVDPSEPGKLMIMDEHWSYALRTAASAGVAVKHLARPGSRLAGILGVGWMARACVWALKEVVPGLQEIRVTSRRQETRTRFAADAGREFGIRVVPVDSVEETVAGADVVIAATTAHEPILRVAWLEPGSVTYAMGNGKEVDDATYWSADKVLVDDWTHCMTIPDFRELVTRGAFSREKLYAELAEVVAGHKPGRESEAERIFVRSEGLAVQDIAIAHQVYQLARARNLGVWLTR